MFHFSFPMEEMQSFCSRFGLANYFPKVQLVFLSRTFRGELCLALIE